MRPFKLDGERDGRSSPTKPRRPSIFKVLHAKVLEQMPKYRAPSSSLSFTVMPLAVSSVDDTVPGLGISGAF